jgi:hypothetical protein
VDAAFATHLDSYISYVDPFIKNAKVLRVPGPGVKVRRQSSRIFLRFVVDTLSSFDITRADRDKFQVCTI